MVKNFHILLIEDEPEKWVHFFKNGDIELENEFLEVDTVSSLDKGKEYITQNHQNLDAVLIEFNFPNILSDNVLECILWIKKKYPLIPIFVLCANQESENVSTITSFIKAGAINYFNITNFKTPYLIAHLLSSQENKKIQQRYELVAKSVCRNKFELQPILITHKINDFSFIGSFSYVLKAVKKPRTTEEENEFLEFSERWHREFYRMLILLLDDKVTLTMRYIKNTQNEQEGKDEVGVFWCFSIKTNNLEELKREYNKTIRDVNLYLGNSSMYPENPYIFTPVVDESILESFNMPNGMFSYSLTRKSFKLISHSNQIGYRHKIKCDESIFLSVFQKPNEWSSINTFCKILSQEKEGTQFTISIKPCNVDNQNKKEASRLASSLAGSFPLCEEDFKEYIKFLEGLSRLEFKPFSINFQLVTWEAIPNDAIMAALFHTFSLEQINNELGSVKNIYFKDIYPDYSLPMFARMPLPQKEGIQGIISKQENFLFLPHDINEEGILIGHKFVNDIWKNIRIKKTDLAQHIYILGQTGTGKSTLLYTMVIDMLENGKHVSLIDPHGDLFDKVVKNLPASCKSNTVLFDPSSMDEMPGINFLQHDPNDSFQKSYLLNAMYVILDNLYDMKLTGGPVFTKYFQAAMRLVMEVQGSLLDIIRVFENKEYRNNLLIDTKDSDLKSEWHEIIASGGEVSFENVSVYITSKLNEFRNNIVLREILAKKEHQLDFSDIMNHGKNLLVRLPIGTLGERGVNLIGQIIFNKFLMTAFSREKIEESQRLDHVLVVDEFHKFTTDAIGKVFSEARKYHLSLVVANQTFSQLHNDVQHILLGNVGSMLFFRPGINDATLVAKYFEPDFNSGELCDLPNYQCAARISINRRPSKPFVFETINFNKE